ncbi:MAG: hypothetical protein WA939_10015 [Nodosilinea sp.]
MVKGLRNVLGGCLLGLLLPNAPALTDKAVEPMVFKAVQISDMTTNTAEHQAQRLAAQPDQSFEQAKAAEAAKSTTDSRLYQAIKITAPKAKTDGKG